MTDTMDFEGRLLTQQECYQIGYVNGREAGLRKALLHVKAQSFGANRDVCAAAIERLLEKKP